MNFISETLGMLLKENKNSKLRYEFKLLLCLYLQMGVILLDLK